MEGRVETSTRELAKERSKKEIDRGGGGVREVFDRGSMPGEVVIATVVAPRLMR